MKILLRSWGNEVYVWRTAKHNGNYFVVDNMTVEECNVISVINDNRKNYVKCSCCGKVFPKKGNKFKIHQELASGINPCLNCGNLRTEEIIGSQTTKYFANEDGTYKEKIEREVQLLCKKSPWEKLPLMATETIEGCRRRNCAKGYRQAIEDAFTRFPGIFDDIITVDKLFDNGYDKLMNHDSCGNTVYVIDDELDLYALVNNLGIVDRFYLDNGDYYDLYYSRKYDKLFVASFVDRYTEWVYCDEDDKEKIMNHIRKIYK